MTTSEKIGRVVDLLLTYRRENRLVLAALLGVSPKTLGRRLNGVLGWTADEIAVMAEHFDVPVSVFYDGPEALLAGTSRSTTAEYVGDIFGGPAASADYLAGDLELVA
jgi:hypothetical protein